MVRLLLTFVWLLLSPAIHAFTHQDSLRGENGSGRSWWDVQHYSLHVVFDTTHRTISGRNEIRATVCNPAIDSLQLDLQELMFLDSVLMDGRKLDFFKEGNVWWIVNNFSHLKLNEQFSILAYYHGKPHPAKLPPWDGGFVWTTDSLHFPWNAVACQGLGASVWWPCKDYQGDKPDSGMILDFISPLPLVSNGRKILERVADTHGYHQYKYEVINPINTYNATFYAGDYIGWYDTLMGEKGKLDLSFFVLKQHEQQARKHFEVVKQMLHCFEYWMGPYPFYEDGYKLVEAPYLGMEHQSAIAYGNQYKMGYRGLDRSGTGVGLLFDFIIVHESGHEWFGNNVTAKDIADNWLHEGFTTYAEALFAECGWGKEKASVYTLGEWKGITNDRPVIGPYGVNKEGSRDEYDKGAAIVHMIRSIINDDEKFRLLLRTINSKYYHQTVTSVALEQFISDFCHYDFSSFFDQYLRTIQIPHFAYFIKKNKIYYRLENCIKGLKLPLTISSGQHHILLPCSTEWQEAKWKYGFDIQVAPNFLLQL
ncbi:MAG: M1 family metallopeptidase [Bacteroidetes bacterium]|nr:M1 family metallopeptidase [Bacteroidota bacterium]